MRTMMIYLSVITAGLAAYVVFLLLKLKRINRNLKELIKENEQQTTATTPEKQDIFFKIDKNFQITFINESGSKMLGYPIEEIIGKPILGTLMEDNPANAAMLKSTLSKIAKNQTTINSQQVILNKNNKKTMWCRQRPILNEVLDCAGISFLCKDISEVSQWQENLDKFQNTDLFTDGLKEEALLKRLEHEFKLAKRYNKEFAFTAIELKDIYDFISKGIDFETADKLLKNISDLCIGEAPADAIIGRLEKTKICLILNGSSRQQALELAQSLYQKAIPVIRSLGIDEYNAQMFIISYTNRKNFNDSTDAMLSRIRRHINTALKRREYGVISSDMNGNKIIV